MGPEILSFLFRGNRGLLFILEIVEENFESFDIDLRFRKVREKGRRSGRVVNDKIIIR